MVQRTRIEGKDMESILDWGISVVIWLQHFSPELDLPFKALTFMGDQPFFMLLLSLLYWCVNTKYLNLPLFSRLVKK